MKENNLALSKISKLSPTTRARAPLYWFALSSLKDAHKISLISIGMQL